MLRVGSLFSGAGLCDLGFTRAGLRHEFFCEIDPFCRSILARHWPGVPAFEDIRALRGAALPKVDLLAGGFPCQDVSSIGKRKGIAENTRSGLWLEFARLIQEVNPRYVLIENVKGLLSGGLEIVLSDLSRLGYAATWHCLPAAALGAPHIRERVFILAYPDSHGHDAKPGGLPALKRALGELHQPQGVAHWAGVRIDRTGRETIRNAYPGTVLCRVDDGSTAGVDKARGRGKEDSAGGAPDCGRGTLPRGLRRISREEYQTNLQRLKALANGITVAQAEAVGRWILAVDKALNGSS